MTANADTRPDHFKLAERRGTFDRIDSKFRNFISSGPDARSEPEKDRYILYITLVCPFAHRANIIRSLKGLEHIIQLIVVDYELHPTGWSFTGRAGTAAQDPIYGFKRFSELYLKSDPEYKGRYPVPVLCDRKEETIVNSESPEIVRMIYSGFDSLLPLEMSEGN